MKRTYIVTFKQGIRILDIVRNYIYAEVETFLERQDGNFDLVIDVSADYWLELQLEISEVIL